MAVYKWYVNAPFCKYYICFLFYFVLMLIHLEHVFKVHIQAGVTDEM